MTVVLVHGGLWEDKGTADRFWRDTGVVAALEGHGLAVRTPQRPPRARSWEQETEHVAAQLPEPPFTLVGASNGVTVAVRLALAGRAARLVLAWPATAGDPRIDAHVRRTMPPEVADVLLPGGLLRGVKDDELGGLTLPVALVPSIGSPFHLPGTVQALAARLPDVRVLSAAPEPPRPDFAAHRSRFAAEVATFHRT